MSDFKAGDRVAISDDKGWLFAAYYPGNVDWCVIVGEGDHDRDSLVVLASKLTLIPDTVSVTVELPRDEADSAMSMWPECPEFYPAAGNRAAARLAEAARVAKANEP